MAYSAKLRSGSFVLLGLGLTAWVLALGGLGSINWLVCTDTANTLQQLGAAPQDASLGAAGIGKDVAVCSRTWKWEWWTLFFEFAVLVSALVVTAMPSRLPRARYPLANLLSIASVLIMIALNSDIQAVWAFWDEKKMFDQWQGVLRKLYMSAAALVAGWVMTCIFNLVWIGFALDTEAVAEGANPITSDPEAARKN